MYYEWKVCNSSQIANHQFPEMTINIELSNYFNQQYRVWETENAFTLYQPGRKIIVLFKNWIDGGYVKRDNDYYKLVRLSDGTVDIYHGQTDGQ